ncbi:MAG: GHKL domain-containing protein [Ruminococcus flavefaciens]|nr:GHKL domain-containing protein [Ruminococcus flavefaciens]
MSKSTYLLIISSVISLELYTSLLFLNDNISNKKLHILQITASMFMVSMIITVLFFIIKDISRKHLQNTAALLEQQVKIQLEHYETLTQLNKDFHSFRHDYRNHIYCIRSLFETENYSEAEAYIDKLTYDFDPELIFIDSGNKIADAILTSKICSAQNSKIDFQFEGTFFSDISPVEICTILSNGIDNAIEACLKVDGIRWINITAAKEKNFQYIEISNSKNPDLTFSYSQNFTSKTDKINHGYGLYNIRKATARYDGKVEIEDKNDTFILTVIININADI